MSTPGHEVGGDTEGFELGPKRKGFAFACGATEVGCGDHADGGVCEATHDLAEVIGGDGDVAVVDDAVVVGAGGDHLDEVADLAGCAEALGTLDEADGDMRELGFEALDFGDGGIGERADAEEDLEATGVALAAVADEAGIHAGVDAFDGLEEGDVRGEAAVFAA